MVDRVGANVDRLYEFMRFGAMDATETHEFRGLGATDVTKPYGFILFGAMNVTKTCESIGFGAMDVTKPYDFLRFGAMDVTKPYEFILFYGGLIAPKTGCCICGSKSGPLGPSKILLKPIKTIVKLHFSVYFGRKHS
jgi:hypothetical protein